MGLSFGCGVKFGGSVVLAPAASLHNFREGDLVTVHGEILNEGRGSRYEINELMRLSELLRRTSHCGLGQTSNQ